MSITGCVCAGGSHPPLHCLAHKFVPHSVRHGIKANGFSTLKHGGKKKKTIIQAKKELNRARDKQI